MKKEVFSKTLFIISLTLKFYYILKLCEQLFFALDSYCYSSH